jgi:L-alanine-DL-glutamate epimerase-like enolase superfamily enzyme
VIGNGINASLQALAELHLACSHAAILPAGEFIGPDKLVDDIVKAPLKIENGEAILPDAPGCGTEIDEEKFKTYTVNLADRKAA